MQFLDKYINIYIYLKIKKLRILFLNTEEKILFFIYIQKKNNRNKII